MRKSEKIKRRLSSSQSIAAGTLSIMFFTVLSKGLGFVREMVLAANFGTSWRLDALIVAMDPALKIGGLLSSAIASMMIPIFVNLRANRDNKALKEYTSGIILITAMLLLAFGCLLTFFPEFFVRLFAPRFNPEETAYAIRKMRIMGLLPLLQGFNTLASSVLKSEKKYMLYSSVQLIFNIVAIPTIILFAPFFSEASYLLAFIVGTFLMNLAFLYIIRGKLQPVGFRGVLKNPAIRETLVLALPLIMSGSLGIINNIVDKAFASSLATGSISSLRYAQTMKGMITSIVVGSLMTTVFTELSESGGKKDHSALEFRLRKSSTDLLNFLIPLTAWAVLMARPLIALFFERGEFTDRSTTIVSAAFIGYSLTIVIAPVGQLISKTFVAFKKTYLTFFISLMSIGLNYLFNFLLIQRFNTMGIAISTSLVSIINILILYYLQRRIFHIDFLDKEGIVKNVIIAVIFFVPFYILRGRMNYALWLITMNLVFLVIFYLMNRAIIQTIILKIKNIKRM